MEQIQHFKQFIMNPAITAAASAVFLLVLMSGSAMAASPIDLNVSWDIQGGDVVFLIDAYSAVFSPSTKIWISSDSGVDIGNSTIIADLDAMKTRRFVFTIRPTTDGNHTLYTSAKSAEKNGSWFGDQDLFIVQKSGNNIHVFDDQNIYVNTHSMGEWNKSIVSYLNNVYPATTGTVNVMGYFYYRDYFYNLKPLKQVKVYIYNSNLMIDELLGTTYTDDNGFFNAGPFPNADPWPENGTLDIQIKAETNGIIAEVKKDLGSDYFYSFSSGVLYDVPDGTVNMGSVTATNETANASSAFDAAVSAWELFNNNGYILPKVSVRWPSRTFLPIIDLDGAYYEHGGSIYLGMDAAISQDVLAHEYGHFAMYNIYGDWFPQTDCPSPHFINVKEPVNCAWTEGWANFLPGSVFNESITNYYGHWTFYLEDGQPGDVGDDVESSVASSLNDIYDSSNDGYDNITAGFGSILNSLEIRRTQNFSEFWSVWKNQGNDVYGGLGALYQNNIDYCQDADLDGYKEKPCGTDCNDTNAKIKPGAAEVCYDGIDNNCNSVMDENCSCTSDCIFGMKQCSSNYAQTCGDYDLDPCFEWPLDFLHGSEQCGTTTTGNWTGDYCEARNVMQNKTLQLRGCSGGDCFSTESVEKRQVAACPFWCAGSLCRRICADVNDDCAVNIFDLANIGLSFGSTAEPGSARQKYDTNGDGVIDIFDLAKVGLKYGDVCDYTPYNLSKEAEDEITLTFSQTRDNFAESPGEYYLQSERPLLFAVGIKNNASDGKGHNFTFNSIPWAVSAEVLNKMRGFPGQTGSCTTVDDCYMYIGQNHTTLKDFMLSFMSWPKEPFLVGWNQTRIVPVSLTFNAFTIQGTYGIRFVACMTDGTGVKKAGDCNYATTNWGSVQEIDARMRHVPC